MRRYKVIVPASGVATKTNGDRQGWSCELTKEVHLDFGEALTRDGAAVVVNIPMDEDFHTLDMVIVGVGSVFTDLNEAPAEDAEAVEVLIEIYTEKADFKASPEAVADWAEENGWRIEEANGIKCLEDDSEVA